MTRLSEFRIPFTYDTSYAYGVGRIRALETQLLTRQEVARLIAAEDTDGYLRLLRETAYGETLTSVTDPDGFEELLNIHLSTALEVVVHLSQDPHVTGLLQSRYDYHNVKVLMKAKRSGQEPGFALSNLGQVEPAALSKAVYGEDIGSLPGHLRQALEVAEDFFSKEIDPQGFDVAVDKEMFAHFLSVLRKANIPFLEGWLEREIDLVNIKTFLRLRWSQRMEELLKMSLCEGGSVSVEFYRLLQDESLDGLWQRFGHTRYAKLVEEGVTSLQTKGSFARLEQLCDGFMMSYLRRAALTTFGVEPLVAYVFMKEFEIKALRTVFVCKWNRLSSAAIQERLPDVYL